MSAAEAGTVATPKELTDRLAADDSLRAVAESLRAGNSATIDGAWGSSKALAIAALARSKPSLVVVVLPHPTDVEGTVEDLRTFGDNIPIVLPALEEIGKSARSRLVAYEEAFGRRLAVLKALAGPDPPRVMVTTIHALLQPLPSRESIAQNSLVLEVRQVLSMDELTRWLTDHGWDYRDAVELPGEFSRRGGILDLFTIDSETPYRIEFFGDEIDSMREFSIQNQRSLQHVDKVVVTALSRDPLPLDKAGTTHLAEVVPPGTWFVLVEPVELKDEGKHYLNRLDDVRGLFAVDAAWSKVLKHPTVVVTAMPYRSFETTCSLHVESIERLTGDVNRIRQELDRIATGDQVLIACHNEGELKRVDEIFRESATFQEGRLRLCLGSIAAGFRWVKAGVVAISDHELFGRTDVRRVAPKRRILGRAIESFLDLKEGDYVVHLGHGIGVFRGMQVLDKNDQREEHLCLEFADKVLVYVPASKIDLVQKYVGSTKTPPRLSKIGGTAWEQRKRAVQAAVADMASDLIEIQASRQAQPGIRFPPESEWYREFEAAFPYTETPDQVTAMQSIVGDMESTRPMDRLLCGDVGYGKTELAMRAAFKAVDFGRQVAVLVPTTVLAQQHFRTFRERMAEYPFVIECVSRFQTKGEQKRILEQTAAGAVDVLIGTHRLVSHDVHFADLGLIIIDEEQRFGVAHKERLKRLRSQVDVLTMTATPIPRTLHSALLGIRDISNLQTPPENRLAVETRIARFDRDVIRHSVLRELNRGGQVYFVHNRVQDIKRIADQLTQAVPEASIAIVHGQMEDDEIEQGMLNFVERRADILLATTIIESGLDIPNANTIFIDEADKYGLADLHQLRGRVGRSHHRAYCYLLVEEDRPIKLDAQRRLKAIEEYSQLGAGFHIALRDLEIRGAGNILGSEQSGHISAVGYELYCQLLENAVRSLKKQPVRSHLDVTVELPWRAYFPAAYMPGERHRLDAYRKLASIREPVAFDDFKKELEDRFGSIPQDARNLIDMAYLRVLSQIWQIESIRPDEAGNLVFKFRNLRRLETLQKIRSGRVKIVDAKTAYVRVPTADHNSAGYCQLLKELLQAT